MEGVGNFFVNKIAKKFPQCIHAVYTSKRYISISMSGVVGRNSKVHVVVSVVLV